MKPVTVKLEINKITEELQEKIIKDFKKIVFKNLVKIN